jgi:hypothetical protein
MASLSFNNIRGYNAGWTISGLQNPFNTNYYLEAGLALSTVASGSSSIDKIATVLAPSSGTSKSVSYNHCKYVVPNYYHTFHGYAKALNGLYYPVADGSFTSASPSWIWSYKGTNEYGSLIPTSDFDYKMSRDSDDAPGFYVSASDWNDMAEWVYLLSVFLGVPNVSMLQSQYLGDVIYDYIFENMCRNIHKLIQVCANAGTTEKWLGASTLYPSSPARGKEISYWQFDGAAYYFNKCYDYYMNL